MRRQLVQQAHVVGEAELAAQPDEVADARALRLAVGGAVALVLAEDAGVPPLPAHLAAQVAEVRDPELHEGRHRDGRPAFEVVEDGAAPAAHAQVVGEGEAGAAQLDERDHPEASSEQYTPSITRAQCTRGSRRGDRARERAAGEELAPEAIPGRPVVAAGPDQHRSRGSAEASRRWPYA